MNQLIESYKDAWSNGFNFSGRTRRSGYWYAVLANYIITFVLSLLGGFVDILTIVGGLYALAFLIPSLALGVRRLHDVGKSGWSLLFSLIPLVGWIFVLIWFCTDSQPDNQYGPSPKGYGPTPGYGYAQGPQQGYQPQGPQNGPEL